MCEKVLLTDTIKNTFERRIFLYSTKYSNRTTIRYAKQQALQAINSAEQTLQQITSTADTQALQQSSQQLQQASHLINQMQGIAVTASQTPTQQQLEQVRQQIEQAGANSTACSTFKQR